MRDKKRGAMRVELTTDGGFAHIPGLAKPVVVDSVQLADYDAEELRRLCDAVPDIAKHRDAPQPSPIPDGRSYRLTIESGDARRELAVADPIAHPAISALIAFVQKRGRRV